jgi:aminoglycoside phosphotransferase (APT) family kinase protein
MAELTQPPPPEVVAALHRLKLVRPGDGLMFTRLMGGVSSDIWKIEAAGRVFCVKRALAQLKVERDWRAPVERSRYEYEWIATAGRLAPAAVPALLGYDETARLMALTYYDPGNFKPWKAQLQGGDADASLARAVGSVIGLIHAGTAGRPEIASRFSTDAIFHAIRLEPYLLATGRVHPQLADRLAALLATTANTKRALVHGDVSPKNILVGPEGPIFLDAECAWYGDPAFDLAFCLNHLLLKCLWLPRVRDRLLICFDQLAKAYFGEVTWEPIAEIETRTARLLPGLLLARIDGKSPVEYITDDRSKDHARRIARLFLEHPTNRLTAIREAWREELSQ